MGCGISSVKATNNDTGYDKRHTIKKKVSNFYDDYIFNKQLYIGSFGEIWSVTNKITKDIHALKMVKKANVMKNLKAEENFKNEVESLIKLDCPHIIKIHALYEDNNKYYVIQEYLKGLTLMEYCEKKKQEEYSEKRIAGFIKQILTALNYCHLNNIIHRDIRPENIMFTDQDCKTLKIIDFGYAKIKKDVDKEINRIMGTPMYMAPEIVEMKPIDSKCDIWSCGIVACILLSGEFPYKLNKKTLSAIFEEISESDFTADSFCSDGWKRATQEAKVFVAKMLRKDPKNRPTAGELLNDPWIVDTPEMKTSKEEAKSYMGNMLNTSAEFKFQHAVITYISYHEDLKEQRESLDKFFANLDKDKSQTITKAELRAGFEEVGIAMAEQDFESLFAKLDTSKNGSISYTEYCAGAFNISTLTTDKFLKDAFDFFDVDMANSLSKEKIKNALSSGWISDTQLKELFQEFDENKDDKINLSEFKKAMKKFAEKSSKK